MGCHLPCRLYLVAPHYNLPQLDNMLRETKVGRVRATVVEGYIFGRNRIGSL